MNKPMTIAAGVILTLGIATIVPVLAGSQHMGRGGMMNGMMPCANHNGSAMHAMQQNPEQHLQEMKSALHLTSTQQPAWDAFEKTVLAQMKTMQGMHNEDHAMHKGPMNGDHMVEMEARFAGMKKVHAARQALFDVLTDEQKESMQHQFPGRHGQHQG